jgi:hypothetical protein
VRGLLPCAVLAIGCGGARDLTPAVVPSPPLAPEVTIEDPPGVAGAKPLEGHLASGKARPRDIHALRFDVDALPVATWGRPKTATDFWFAQWPGGYRVTIRGPLFAEIVVRRPTSWFSVFTGGKDFSTGEAPACGGANPPTLPAYWTGISSKNWTDGGIDVEMGRGDFHGATCVGVSRASLSGRAAAIVPGYVYGLRVRVPSTAIEPADERLVIFLPRSQLVAAGEDPLYPVGTTNTGPFTRLSLRMDPGSVSSASVRLSPASLDLWTTLRRTRRPVWSFTDTLSIDEDLLLGLDVVSQGKARMGSVFVSLPQSTAGLGAYGELLAALSAAPQ